MNPKKSILIVEDDVSLLRALRDNFIQEGFTVLSATNGEEGLARALGEHPDLILLDLILPQKDGIYLLTRLREDPWGKDVKVIILSNVSDTTKVAEAMAHETFNYLVKSDVDMQKVVRTVKEHLSDVKS